MKNSIPHTEIVSEDIDQHVSFVIKKLSSVCSKLEEGSLSFHYGGRPIRARKIDVTRVISQTKFENELHQCVKNIILEAVLTSESIACGAGFFLLKQLTQKKKMEASDFTNRSTINDLNSSLSDLMGVGLSKEVVFSIIKESSIDSDVILNTSPILSNVMIRSRPATSLPGEMHPLFDCKRKRLENIGIVIVDGIIESLSDIDTLLKSLAKDKKSVALITRGYNPDIIATLLHNYKSGNLYMYPFQAVGKDDIFSQLEGSVKFYDLDNFQLIRDLTSSELEYNSEIFVNPGSIEIIGGNSLKKKVYVTFPNHFKNVMGVLNDRILMGLKLSREIARSGNVKILECQSTISRLAHSQSKKGLKSLEASLKNLGCAVLQET